MSIITTNQIQKGLLQEIVQKRHSILQIPLSTRNFQIICKDEILDMLPFEGILILSYLGEISEAKQIIKEV